MTDEIMNNATELNEEELEEVSGGKISFGELPGASKALLGGLVFCWLCMGIYAAAEKLKKKS